MRWPSSRCQYPTRSGSSGASADTATARRPVGSSRHTALVVVLRRQRPGTPIEKPLSSARTQPVGKAVVSPPAFKGVLTDAGRTASGCGSAADAHDNVSGSAWARALVAGRAAATANPATVATAPTSAAVATPATTVRRLTGEWPVLTGGSGAPPAALGRTSSGRSWGRPGIATGSSGSAIPAGSAISSGGAISLG